MNLKEAQDLLRVDRYISQKDLKKITARLLEWLESRYPLLAKHLETEVALL